MTPEDHRLECLRLAIADKPGTPEQTIKVAEQYAKFVNGEPTK